MFVGVSCLGGSWLGVVSSTCWMDLLHVVVGSVPGIKYSVIVLLPAFSASAPFDLQTARTVKVFGTENFSAGVFMRSCCIRLLQIGAAPDEPATLLMGELSLLPIHTPMARLGV